ncbi:MAG: hypothetical protein RMI56_02615 [Sulfolobales archaeon]|nr:hypothetical protein [Sulfolobales archaeon]
MAFSGVLGEVGDALEGALTWRQRFSIACVGGACGRDGPVCRESCAAGLENFFRKCGLWDEYVSKVSEDLRRSICFSDLLSEYLSKRFSDSCRELLELVTGDAASFARSPDIVSTIAGLLRELARVFDLLVKQAAGPELSLRVLADHCGVGVEISGGSGRVYYSLEDGGSLVAEVAYVEGTPLSGCFDGLGELLDLKARETGLKVRRYGGAMKVVCASGSPKGGVENSAGVLKEMAEAMIVVLAMCVKSPEGVGDFFNVLKFRRMAESSKRIRV